MTNAYARNSQRFPRAMIEGTSDGTLLYIMFNDFCTLLLCLIFEFLNYLEFDKVSPVMFKIVIDFCMD